MKLPLALMLLSIAFSQICEGQPPVNDSLSAKEFYNEEFKWKILIPSGFDTVNNDHSNAFCFFEHGESNHFEANSAPFDKKKYGSFLTVCRKVNDELYHSLSNLIPDNSHIDTVSSTEIINELKFQRYKLRISNNNQITLTVLMYFRLFENKIFTVNIEFTKKEEGDKILNAWRNSKFDQN